jgi:hypothetical protein
MFAFGVPEWYRGGMNPVHPFWDKDLGAGVTPRLLIGIVVVVAVFVFGGFAQQP